MERQIPWTKPNRSAKPSPQSARVQQLNGLATLLRAAKYSRLILAGGPRAGKSHLAEALRDDGIRLYGSDDLIGLGWSEASAKASEWFDSNGPWIAEGVAMPRALRKWIARSPGRPADCVVWLGSRVVDRSPGQEAMALGCHTVWNEVAPHLRNRGVTVLEMH